MPREIRPWYRPHIEWKSVLCSLIFAALAYWMWGQLWLKNIGWFWPFVLCVLGFWLCAGIVWNNRHPRLYPVRRRLKARAFRIGRDEYRVKIGKRSVDLCVEMMSSRGTEFHLDCVVDVSWMSPWNSPHQTESFSDQEKREVLDVLIEELENDNARFILSDNTWWLSDEQQKFLAKNLNR